MRQQRPDADPRAQDREILRLALPAFGALAAEPLYVLADTAIVGHLGTRPLGGLGVAAAVLLAVFGVFNFLAYGTTSRVARSLGAGDDRGAVEYGVAGCWLGALLGVTLMVVGLLLVAPVVHGMGASAAISPYAQTYLRISLIGAPFQCIALAGTGFLRGMQDTRTPLVIAIAANMLNLALELALVYGLHTGIAGSAWGTVVAQITAALVYLALVGRSVRRAHASVRPQPRYVRDAAVVGSFLVVRTASLLVAFTTATAIASRLGDVQVAAHQVAIQVWTLLALTLDAIAIAAQAIVGRALGAGERARTRLVSRRMIQWGVKVGAGLALLVLVTEPLVVLAFTRDPAVRRELYAVLAAVALMQPLGAIVFVLDGILIGAGDARYLALAMVAATATFLPFAFLVLAANAGLLALWASLYVFMLARLYGMYRRYRSDEWLVTGAAAA